MSIKGSFLTFSKPNLHIAKIFPTLSSADFIEKTAKQINTIPFILDWTRWGLGTIKKRMREAVELKDREEIDLALGAGSTDAQETVSV